ncbi:hypothetical protein P7K49_030739 [Saguinus oedipus]|uniref:Uncharacterized protein n=1 Tax=Saguinus oedipus TaxID=9490 RepID=A0ABQ9U3V4_SAGOE|nr:hypothetical protein P7K49_030739 [Saguinus oedipus]
MLQGHPHLLSPVGNGPLTPVQPGLMNPSLTSPTLILLGHLLTPAVALVSSSIQLCIPEFASYVCVELVVRTLEQTIIHSAEARQEPYPESQLSCVTIVIGSVYWEIQPNEASRQEKESKSREMCTGLSMSVFPGSVLEPVEMNKSLTFDAMLSGHMGWADAPKRQKRDSLEGD